MTTPQLSQPLADVAAGTPSNPAPPAAGPPRSTSLREAVTFVGLVFVIVTGTALALPHAGFITPMLAMQTPVLVVLLITVFETARGRRGALLSSLGVRRLGLRSWPVAFAVAAVAILVLPYSAAVALGSAALAPLNSSAGFWFGSAASVVIDLAIGTVLLLGEEIGWRGYLLPRVQALTSKRWAALAVGFVHGLFHLPLILLTTTYDSVGSRWVVAPMVVVTVTLAGVIYGWLRDRSGSVWPVAVAHATINNLIAGGGLIIVVAPVTLAYTAGESGVATLVAVLGFAAVLLVRGSTWRSSVASATTR